MTTAQLGEGGLGAWREIVVPEEERLRDLALTRDLDAIDPPGAREIQVLDHVSVGAA